MSNEVIQQEEPKNTGIGGVFSDIHAFESAQRMANALASSDLLPKQYQGNIGNCLIGLEMANRMKMNPMQVMQEMAIIHGKPTFSAKFLIAMVNSCGRFSPLRYKFNEQRTACKAYATDLSTGELVEGATVTMKMAQDEGWATKPGSKWKTMPQLMMQYRSATFFSRAYCPEMSLGLMTHDEMEDIKPARAIKDITDIVNENNNTNEGE